MQMLLKSLLLSASIAAMQPVGPARAQAIEPAMHSYLTSGPGVHQLRIYKIFDHNKDAFHARFRDHAARIMKRYGFHIVSMWETRSPDGPEFVYLLKWPSEEIMKAQWQKFMADEEWAQIKLDSTARYGKVVDGIEERVMRLTAYSAQSD